MYSPYPRVTYLRMFLYAERSGISFVSWVFSFVRSFGQLLGPLVLNIGDLIQKKPDCDITI
jgi:hypothetical protein